MGIGPDAEVFSKAQVLSSVGVGADVGLHPISTWNNPEPEVVLAVTSRGEIKGATLGNDVNLRDVEGRSALLLSKAKDNNASCAIGPMIRLFDAGFTLDDVRTAELALRVVGEDGYVLISRGDNTCGISMEPSYPTEVTAASGATDDDAAPAADDDDTSGTTHYSDPNDGGCLSDELEIQITGVSGACCSAKCTTDPCPTDVRPWQMLSILDAVLFPPPPPMAAPFERARKRAAVSREAIDVD